ncbi:acyl-CoA dehydrogenase [Streptosporangium jomthongense]|uniref:Acyl-CoA dehydrogenase family protein n=1 Tax=Marinobacter aromaticivorans TaxID=1494078 RepID=A0ABW2ITK8_9GAMM|nr:acyl-CoA dehydrogenase family protein [Marinobacter aromaticivorans]GGE59303.1 acyl-CoA dehydrogenase [Streptosporangium jomthongense]
MINRAMHLEGHLPADHRLAPHWQFAALPRIAQQITSYQRDDLWASDTRRLPAPLAQLRRRARTFAETYLAPLSAEADLAMHTVPGQHPPAITDMLKVAAREGWLSYFLPRPLGSMSWKRSLYPPVWQSSLVVEEFSRVCGGLMLLLSAHHLGCIPLLLSGDIKVIRRFLAPVYRSCHKGDPHLVAFAITEPGAGSDAEDGHGARDYKPGVVASRCQGGWKLNGRKCFISGGDMARTLTVFAALEGEGMESWTCFYVDAASPGFRVARNEMKMGMRASGAADLEFTEVFVPDSHVIGGLRKGWVLNRASLNTSRIPVASMAVGFARAATEQATTFACRYQLGGKALIHYQDVQQHIATMVAETRAIRSMVWQEARNAWKPRQLNASACKFHATNRAQIVVEMALDLLADQGGLQEQKIEKIFRDVRLTRIFEGTNQINQLSVIEDWQDQLLPLCSPSSAPIGV